MPCALSDEALSDPRTPRGPQEAVSRRPGGHRQLLLQCESRQAHLDPEQGGLPGLLHTRQEFRHAGGGRRK